MLYNYQLRSHMVISLLLVGSHNSYLVCVSDSHSKESELSTRVIEYEPRSPSEMIHEQIQGIRDTVTTLTKSLNPSSRAIEKNFNSLISYFKRTFSLFDDILGSDKIYEETKEETKNISADITAILSSIKKQLIELLARPANDNNTIIKLNDSIKSLEDFTNSLLKNLQEAFNIKDKSDGMMGLNHLVNRIKPGLAELINWTKTIKSTKEKNLSTVKSPLEVEKEKPIASISIQTSTPIETRAVRSLWYKTIFDRFRGKQITSTQTTTMPVAQEAQQPSESLVERVKQNFWRLFGYK